MPADRRPRPGSGRSGAAALPYASPYHVPVLVREVVDLLVEDPAGTYVDATLGGGGHAAALLDALAPEGRVVGLDRDPEALAAAAARLAGAGDRLRLLRGNFADLAALLEAAAVGPVDGVLLDLGVSSHQLDEPARGFAFAAEGPLDMRMDPQAGTPAAELANTLPEGALADLLFAYGEEPRARRVARAIAARRPLATTADLAAAVRAAVPPKEHTKTLARVFQAFRIAVNDELGALERALGAALRVLRPGGRLAVIAYHSLEDRRVKHFLRYGNFANEPVRDVYGHLLTPWEPVTRRAVRPADEEVAANPRARSARLRVARKRDPEASGLGDVYAPPT